MQEENQKEPKLRKKPGRKSDFSETLGNTIKKNPRFPALVWELLYDTRMKRVLNRMAIDEQFRNEIWNTIPENK